MKTVVRTLAGIMAVLLSFASMNVLAQEHPDRCGTMPVLEAAFKADPTLKTRFEQQEIQLQQFIAARKNNPAAKEAATLTVPVVFHIVMPNPAVVTDAQVQAQIDTLNKIYGGLNADSIRIPSYFKSLFGRAGIQFCLAKRGP